MREEVGVRFGGSNVRLLLKLGAVIALLFPAAPAIVGGPAISLSAKAQHPEARVAIHGASFVAVERVDVFR